MGLCNIGTDKDKALIFFLSVVCARLQNNKMENSKQHECAAFLQKLLTDM